MLASPAHNRPTRRKCWTSVVAVVAISLFVLMAWGKYDFCSGWAKHYERRAMQLRIDASNPALPAEDVYEHLIVAEYDEIIARKYWRAAFLPWPFGSHPKAPLVSQQEQAAVLQQLADNGQLPRNVADELLAGLLTSK